MEDSTENSRLKEIRKTLGFTQKEFSKNVGIKQGSYSDIERGKVGISANLMRNLVIKYRINPTWLYDGEGQQFLEEEPHKGIAGVIETNTQAQACQNCENMRNLIEAHIQTIETQKDYIDSLKKIIANLKKG